MFAIAAGADKGRRFESHILDNPAWAALTGPQAPLAQRLGQAARFPPGVSPFVAISDPDDPQSWRDLAELLGPGGTAALAGGRKVPEGWEITGAGPGVQLVATTLHSEHDHEALRLTAADVPEMLELTARTQPGPFLERTIEMGTYLGIRREGALVAMAGERLHPPGFTEISAVCTAAAYRGQGLASRLVRAVAQGSRDRGETPFLHAAASNTNAIRLYEAMGFTPRWRPEFVFFRVPGEGQA